MSNFIRVSKTFAHVLFCYMKVFLIVVATCWMIVISAFMGEVFTTEPLHHTAKILIERELGIEGYKVKKAFHEYTFVDPDGEWWIELDEGFAIEKIKKNIQFSDRHSQAEDRDPTELVDKSLLLGWGYKEPQGFESFYAERLAIGDDTSCRKDMLRDCRVRVYAKDGDKNLFIYISIW